MSIRRFDVGWRDRDWARFTDEEWRAIYGAGQRVRRQGPDRTRRIMYGVVAVATVTVVAFAVIVAPPHVTTSTAAPTPSVLYGNPGPNAALDQNGPSGSNTVCTEMVASPSSKRWYCLAWQINLSHLPVVQPHPYRGPCEHMVIDQTRGAWTCLDAGSSPPATPGPIDNPRNNA